MSEKIKCCINHDKIVPLIFTYKFDSTEWWCPYCEDKTVFFGIGKELPATNELKKLHDNLKQQSSDYLKKSTDIIWEYPK